MTAFYDCRRQCTETVSTMSVTVVSHCPDLSLWVCPPTHRWVHFSIFGPERGSIIEKQKLGHPCFRNPLVCMCETQATSTIYALQTATSFRHTFKGKVTSSHYTACTHYAVLYIDPSLICRMCTSLYINAARYLERLEIFSNALYCVCSICHLGKQVNYWRDYFSNHCG